MSVHGNGPMDTDVISLKEGCEFAQVARVKRDIGFERIRVGVVQVDQPTGGSSKVPEANARAVGTRWRPSEADRQPSGALRI